MLRGFRIWNSPHGGRRRKPLLQEEGERPGRYEEGLSGSVREKAFFFSCFVVWGQKTPYNCTLHDVINKDDAPA